MDFAFSACYFLKRLHNDWRKSANLVKTTNHNAVTRGNRMSRWQNPCHSFSCLTLMAPKLVYQALAYVPLVHLSIVGSKSANLVKTTNHNAVTWGNRMSRWQNPCHSFSCLTLVAPKLVYQALAYVPLVHLGIVGSKLCPSFVFQAFSFFL